MELNQPDQPDNKIIADDVNDDTTPLDKAALSQQVVDKVVDKLSKLGGLDGDPNSTWSPSKKEGHKPQLDLTLTEEDEDYSTQPIPSEILIDSELKKDENPNAIISTQEMTISAKIVEIEDEKALAKTPTKPPWTLQQFFNGEVDLDVELARRFPNMPMMSILKTRELGSNTGRKVAELTTQDGAASLIIDADTKTKVIQMSFTFGSMITLKFVMDKLSDMDRDRWVNLMRREAGGLSFLWGTERWSSDYMICISRKHFTNMYAFSPSNFEAGVRLTPKLTKDILDWLEKIWDEPEPDDEPPQLLTW